MNGLDGQNSSEALTKRLTALVWRARATLAFENAWPRIVGLIALAALFALVGWLGAWAVAPAALRMGGVALFALAALAILASFYWVRPPQRLAGLSRIDRDSGAPHQPASAHDDANAFKSPRPRRFGRCIARRSKRRRPASS